MDKVRPGLKFDYHRNNTGGLPKLSCCTWGVMASTTAALQGLQPANGGMMAEPGIMGKSHHKALRRNGNLPEVQIEYLEMDRCTFHSQAVRSPRSAHSKCRLLFTISFVCGVCLMSLLTSSGPPEHLSQCQGHCLQCTRIPGLEEAQV